MHDYLKTDQTFFALTQPPKPEISPSREDTVTKTIGKSSHEPFPHTDSAYTQVLIGAAPLRYEEIGGYHTQDFNGDELDLSKIRKLKPDKKSAKTEEIKEEGSISTGSDRRRVLRHNFKIAIVLVSKLRSFRTYSKNISLSGTLLETEVPKEFLNKPFDLIIVNPFEADQAKARLHFKSKIVGDLKDPRRLMFIEQDAQMTLRLDALLKAYIAYQEQVRKKTG